MPLKVSIFESEMLIFSVNWEKKPHRGRDFVGTFRQRGWVNWKIGFNKGWGDFSNEKIQ